MKAIIYSYDLNSFGFYEHPITMYMIQPKGSIYGVYVVGTWTGAIDLESIQGYIDEAKRIFKERTGQEGKVYVIGEQV